MRTNDGFQFAYNAQAAVDEGSQLIIVTKVTQVATDVNGGIPRIEATTTSLRAANIIRSPRVFLADAGYFSEANLTQVKHKRTLRNRTHQAQRSSECIPPWENPKEYNAKRTFGPSPSNQVRAYRLCQTRKRSSNRSLDR
jgi:hypothetical protein